MATPVAGSIRDVLIGGLQVAAVVLAAPIVRSWYNRWGARAAELTAAMPGDELVRRPRLGYTRAIDIRATPAAVWPWLVQIGQGRGGLYSYDGLENLVGCRLHSADRILAEFQRLAPGDLIRLGPAGYPCFRVQQVRPGSTLVLLSAAPRPTRGDPAHGGTEAGVASWQWQLLPLGEACTRLVVRQRLDYPDRFGLMWRLVEPVGFVMERRMLHGLKQRAERASRSVRNVRPPR
jgi:hypothetical protein